jgi:hypothetical protein
MRNNTVVAAGMLLFSGMGIASNAQTPGDPVFRDISIRIDTLSYSARKDTVSYQGRNCLFFQYNKENEVCDVKLYPTDQHKIKSLTLIESGDFNLVDSLINYNNQYYTFKVQFQHLSESSFLRFRLRVALDSTSVLEDVPLLPVARTSLSLKSKIEDLSVGEEKSFEVTSNLPLNIKLNQEWQSSQDVEYKLTANNGQVILHLLPNSLGPKMLTINLQSNQPSYANKKLNFDLPPLNCSFNVKSEGLVFLQIDKNEFTLDDKTKSEGVEIQLENNKYLQLNSVYLVEAREEPGSPLIAEIITRERLSNNKMLCVLRAFNYHHKADGYLFIKDGNEAKFISNFNIIPKVSIDKIKIMRNGKDWTDDANIYPGETFNLRLEGQSLDKAQFRFGELINLTNDSLVKNENFAEFKLKVPLSISKKSIEIYNYSQNTGKTLTIKEYQKAHPLDYVAINYGGKHKPITEINGPELYDKTIRDLTISFMPDKLDSITKLYGKQYLTIDAKILGKKDEIIDMATIDEFAVCPGEKSPRYNFYDKSDCKNGEISLNSKISNTTYSLSDWSKIKLTFKNPADKYSQDAQSKSVEIVLQKHYNFDIDVSFPTGLLIKKMNTSGYGNFGGVSMAIIGQYSFYAKDKINKLKPYKVGAGFLALNAFDFSNDKSSRDIGAVVLGTLNPVNTDRKLTFSIYLGGGYLLSGKTFFWLIGPGINVQI